MSFVSRFLTVGFSTKLHQFYRILEAFRLFFFTFDILSQSGFDSAFLGQKHAISSVLRCAASHVGSTRNNIPQPIFGQLVWVEVLKDILQSSILIYFL